jgi:hypothetical protein
MPTPVGHAPLIQIPPRAARRPLDPPHHPSVIKESGVIKESSVIKESGAGAIHPRAGRLPSGTLVRCRP